MTTATISQLKMNPSSVIAQAIDYPVAVANRSKVQAYLVGKQLYEKMIAFIEDYSDTSIVKQTDFSKGRDFEKVAKELEI